MSRLKTALILAICLGLGFAQLHSGQTFAQTASANEGSAQIAQQFQFASDGPLSQVWGRAEEVPRVFFPERLPAYGREVVATLAMKAASAEGRFPARRQA